MKAWSSSDSCSSAVLIRAMQPIEGDFTSSIYELLFLQGNRLLGIAYLIQLRYLSWCLCKRMSHDWWRHSYNVGTQGSKLAALLGITFFCRLCAGSKVVRLWASWTYDLGSILDSSTGFFLRESRPNPDPISLPYNRNCGLFPKVWSDRSLKLICHLHLLFSFRMRGFLPPNTHKSTWGGIQFGTWQLYLLFKQHTVN
jgi:hypothetical protein